MSAIFISHSSRDAEFAQDLRERLKGQNYESVFLDCDPDAEGGIPAGARWEDELRRRLESCRALIVLCSEHSMRSRWCFAEFMLAKLEGKEIFPVKVGACEIDSSLTERQWIDLSTKREDEYKKLWEGMRKAGLDPKDMFYWSGDRPPFPGLCAFEESDAGVYFGRRTDVRKLCELLNRTRSSPEKHLLLVLGPSGCGKSSLVRAGVVPRLKRDRNRWLVLPPFRPHTNPFDQLAGALVNAFKEVGSVREQLEIREILEAAGRRTAASNDRKTLKKLFSDLVIAGGSREACVVLVIDQFEELFGKRADELPDTSFSKTLRVIAENDDVILLVTLRSDRLGALQKDQELKQTYRLFELESIKLDEVIQGPADQAGINVSPKLVQQMVDETANEDALPLLAHTLARMYQHCGKGRPFTADAYSAVGGVRESVATTAEEILQGQSDRPIAENLLRKGLKCLVQVSWTLGGSFVLQTTDSLSTMAWADSPTGTTNFITQPVLGTSRFFRIRP